MKESEYNSLETNILSLARALGEDEKEIQKRIQNKSKIRIYEDVFHELLEKRRKLTLKHGIWMRDLIDLKSHINSIDLLASNPREQKKAYDALCLFLKVKQLYGNGLAKWEFIVDDSAFGKMELFKEGDETDDISR